MDEDIVIMIKEQVTNQIMLPNNSIEDLNEFLADSKVSFLLDEDTKELIRKKFRKIKKEN